MFGRAPGFLPPLIAAGVTLFLGWLMAGAAAGSGPVDPLQGMTLVLLLPAPLLVSVVWGWAVLAARPQGHAVQGAVGWVILGLVLLPQSVVWQLAGHVAAGWLGGLALGRRWRLDAALAVVVIALLPLWVWSVLQVPVADQIEALNAEILAAIETNLPADADEADRARALEAERRRLESITNLASRIYPFWVAVGLLGQAGIILVGVRLASWKLGLSVAGWQLPPFSRWRLPFYLVWALIFGLGLMLTRMPYAADGGLNLALLAASLLSIQGIAVQFFVTGRIFSRPARVVYWTVMGTLFVLLVLASGALLGLIDQWADLRRLNAAVDTGPGDAGDK